MSPGARPAVAVHDAFCLHPLPDGAAVAALRGLSLTVAPGERVAVHGPNGSGKTTLLRVLAGEQRLAAGTATVAGLDLGTAPARELARWRGRSLGLVEQDPRRTLRPELDVLGNVALQLRLAGAGDVTARAAAALDRLALGHLADRRPATLSGGEAQRVAVCAAIAHGPAVVLADEPTGELDAESAAAVYDALAAAVEAAGATLVLVSHDRRAARVADRVVRIRDGRISETWWPAAGEEPVREALVVDDRGWVRLPEALRAGLGTAVEVTKDGDGRGVLLEPAAEVAEPEPPVVSPLPAGAPVSVAAAELAAVSVVLGGRPVLSGFSATVAAGELLLITGPSGAGKTTLLRVLTGLVRPDAGRVRLAGTDLAGLDRAALARLRARHTAMVAQDVFLAGTADAVTSLDLARAVRGLPAEPQEELAWLEAVGMAGLAHRPIRRLSGGERQRVAVARALSTGAGLVILDEPTSQLDEAAAELLAGVLRQAVSAGRTVVAASHDPVLLNAATRRISLS